MAQATNDMGRVAPVPATNPKPAAAVPATPDKGTVSKRAKPAPATPANKQTAAIAPASKAAAVQQNEKPALEPAKPEAKPSPAVNTPPPEVKEEKPATVQSQPAPAPVTTAAKVERQAPAPENSAPVNPVVPERKPAASTPASAAESPAPAAQPAAPPARNLVLAVPLSQASPIYPELALRTRSSGSVVLELQIDEQGKVVKATPVSGSAMFYNAAVTAAMKWRYKPATIGGVTVRSQSRITMDFNLKK
jgi:protein TonB